MGDNRCTRGALTSRGRPRQSHCRAWTVNKRQGSDARGEARWSQVVSVLVFNIRANSLLSGSSSNSNHRAEAASREHGEMSLTVQSPSCSFSIEGPVWGNAGLMTFPPPAKMNPSGELGVKVKKRWQVCPGCCPDNQAMVLGAPQTLEQ